MRSFLRDAILRGRATVAPPTPGAESLDEVARALSQRARRRLGRSLSIREVEQSLSLIDQILDRLPAGATGAALKPGGAVCEGMAIVEAFRGDVLAWLRLDGEGRIDRCHLRDPSWFQWPLLEAAIEGNIIADFPLCNKSFNCSYAGHDI